MEKSSIDKKLFIIGNVLSELAVLGIKFVTITTIGGIVVTLMMDYRAAKRKSK